jgi:LPXTG-motif cell wall-anchored protein
VLTGKDTSGTFGFVVVAAAPSASPTPSTAPSSGSGSGDDLAHTGGGSLAPAVTIGLTLLGLGFVAVMTVRRRRRVS